jgi:hypothetical protein
MTTSVDVVVKQEDQQVAQIPEELADSKIYEKLSKEMGDEGAREFFRRSNNELRGTLAECSIQKAEIAKERDDNPAYKNAKSVVSDFNKASRDSCKLLELKLKAGAMIMAYRNEVKRAK